MTRFDATTVCGGFLTGTRVYGDDGKPIGLFIDERALQRMISPDVARRINRESERGIKNDQL